MAQPEKGIDSDLETISFEIEVLPWTPELLEVLPWEPEMLVDAERRLTELLEQSPNAEQRLTELLMESPRPAASGDQFEDCNLLPERLLPDSNAS